MKFSMKPAAVIAGLALAAIAIQTPAQAKPWVTAYYTSQTFPTLPVANVDMHSITHLTLFSLTPNADGTLYDKGGDTAAGGSAATSVNANAAAFVSAVHQAGNGKCALICIGGGGTAANFESAISPAHQAAFITNIKNWVVSHGFDGVDIDMEPLMTPDKALFQSFIQALRTSFGSQYLITTAATCGSDADPSIYAGVAECFDQINVMTYDLAGNWPGWVSWYNSPLYTGGATFPDGVTPLPSCDNQIARYIAAGISPSRLAIGAAFYGYNWQGVTGPNQNLANVPTNYPQAISYAQIMSQYYAPSAAYWDSASYAPYLSLRNGTVQSPLAFISYDDPTLIADKVKYVIANHLGGLMCWQVLQQYIPTAPVGQQQQPLLGAIDGAMGTGATITTTDNLSDFSEIVAKSLNWTIDTTNSAYYQGDTGRATRTVNGAEFLDYSYPNISEFSAKIYTWYAATTSVTFWYSKDNGATYTQAATTTNAKTITTSPWGYSTIKNTGILPVGVTSLRVQIAATSQNWDPQIASISITHQ
jgi:chitinase